MRPIFDFPIVATAFLAALALLLPALPAAASDSYWSAVDRPLEGVPRVIGAYANGCVAGARSLAPEGKGYQVIRLSRDRHYGHPALIRFLKDLGQRVSAAGLGRALVADMAQPRGGPMPSGHTSHQTGLDADIWLRLDLPLLSLEAREDVTAVLMVDRDRWTVDQSVWGDPQADMIRLAASDPRVARIFVHPAIKQDLCTRRWDDRSWLRTVRPWYGHDSHFHIRLHCPVGDTACEAQAPPPPGDGCGQELASWMPDPNAPPAPARPPPPPKILPVACQALITPVP